MPRGILQNSFIISQPRLSLSELPGHEEEEQGRKEDRKRRINAHITPADTSGAACL